MNRYIAAYIAITTALCVTIAQFVGPRVRDLSDEARMAKRAEECAALAEHGATLFQMNGEWICIPETERGRALLAEKSK